MYDKAVNRKSKVHFHPRQTLDYLKSHMADMDLSYETKRNIVKQYLDVSIHFYVLSLFVLFHSQEYAMDKWCDCERVCADVCMFFNFRWPR